MKDFKIGRIPIGENHPVVIIAEVGINHEGSMEKAMQMIDDAAAAGAQIVKFQMHVVEDEMAPVAKEIIPGHTTDSIWDIMKRCALGVENHKKIQAYCKKKGVEYLCTPFSRAAAIELEQMNVPAYKIGSGECNNYPLVKHIASYGKPVIISTGMNNLEAVAKSVEILKKADVPHIIMQCTSMYPTPYEKVNLGALEELKKFDCPVGLSDHSLGIYTCLGAVALGVSVLEKHFTSDKTWEGPDIAVSIDPDEVAELVKGAEAIRRARGGSKQRLDEEEDIVNFAYASIVTTAEVKKGDIFSKDNLWVKRPGTGIRAERYEEFLGKIATRDLDSGTIIKEEDAEDA